MSTESRQRMMHDFLESVSERTFRRVVLGRHPEDEEQQHHAEFLGVIEGTVDAVQHARFLRGIGR